MTGMLNDNTRLRTRQGADVRVQAFIGSGGQGEVFKVTVDGEPKALKWYFPQNATAEQRAIITELVEYGVDDRRFLWPETLVTRDGDPSFGYTMGLRPDNFAGLPDLFKRRVQTKPRQLITACLLVVEAYQLLHRDGIAYRDISWGNVFFDPSSGDVLICDNDNAVFEGKTTGIAGTMEFMAPELVLSEPGATPGVQTDLHSLAVLLFLMLMNHHPLEGARELEIRCMEENAKKLLYGRDPIFIFDPTDRRNKAVAPEHDTAIQMWQFCPPMVRRLFVEAFTRGLKRPQDRVRESQWIEALSRCRDSIITCRNCLRQNMTEPGSGEDFGTCWKCARPLKPFAALNLQVPGRGARALLLGQEAQIYAHHLGEAGSHDFQLVRAEVRQHPQHPDQLGLTNLTSAAWEVSATDGSRRQVLPGRSISLRDGLSINIGPVIATVRRYR